MEIPMSYLTTDDRDFLDTAPNTATLDPLDILIELEEELGMSIVAYLKQRTSEMPSR